MKKVMLICAPVTSRSGYGDHARDLVHSFIKHNKYNVKILDVPWGECPRNALDDNNINDKKTSRAATQHYEIIHRFGRFPHRNAILGRENTPEEINYLRNPPNW